MDPSGLVETASFDGSWLLTAAADLRVRAIARTRAPSGMLDETLDLRLRTSATREGARALRSEAQLARSRPRR